LGLDAIPAKPNDDKQTWHLIISIELFKENYALNQGGFSFREGGIAPDSEFRGGDVKNRRNLSFEGWVREKNRFTERATF